MFVLGFLLSLLLLLFLFSPPKREREDKLTFQRCPKPMLKNVRAQTRPVFVNLDYLLTLEVFGEGGKKHARRSSPFLFIAAKILLLIPALPNFTYFVQAVAPCSNCRLVFFFKHRLL